MALSTYPQDSKQTTLSDGTTYAYAYRPAAQADKATFLLLHGFPSSSYDWRSQYQHLADKGFGLLIPDLLGYGDTDAPSEVEAYSLKRMSGHIEEILEKEGLKNGVIAVGHDWGSVFLSRIYTWNPKYLNGLVFLSVGYMPLSSDPFDLDAMNAMTEKIFGYPLGGYWEFLGKANAGELIDKHPDSFTSLAYPADPDLWKTDLCPIGAAEAWTTSNKKAPLPTWLSKEEAETHGKILAQKGYHGPTSWYKQALQNVDLAAVRTLDVEARNRIELPTMVVLSDKDPLGRVEIQKETAAKCATDVRIEVVHGGHWILIENAEELNELLESFASKVGVKASNS